MSNNNDRNEFDHDNQPPRDELDAMLRSWHEVNREKARAGRDRLLATLSDNMVDRPTSEATPEPAFVETFSRPEHKPVADGARPGRRSILARFLAHPYARAAASFALVAVLAVLFLPKGLTEEARADVTNVARGGQLEAFDAGGVLIGPCPLEHTDVSIEVSGPFSRVTVKQQYTNPYQSKIEAVYTFPLSHRAAVDRMRMIIDKERIVDGEVKEREEARQIYEQAKAANHVAGLLEQERSNIFTQSVANIESGASVEIEISYIETVEQIDGVYSLAFPMTVSPRYIPGYPSLGGPAGAGNAPVDPRMRNLPLELERSNGLLLRGPGARFRNVQIQWPHIDEGRPNTERTLGWCPDVQRLLDTAIGIMAPTVADYRNKDEHQAAYWELPMMDLTVVYRDGSREGAQIAGDGLGHIAGRWFWFDRDLLRQIDVFREAPLGGPAQAGAPISGNTNQVPDASRITPMPVHPGTRAGHDIGISVTIDTGGPELIDIGSESHDVTTRRVFDPRGAENDGSEVVITLKNQNEIPNRDFVLSWTVDQESIEEATFVHAGEDFDDRGGFFTLILAPPARIENEMIRPRELVFVLDTSGSMSGEPIAKAKAVMTRAIDTMRDGDTFNIITFAGDTHILWPEPRPSNNANRAEALAFINSRDGSGGTEMMKAINAALVQTSDVPVALTPDELANLPADGRAVLVDVVHGQIVPEGNRVFGAIRPRGGLQIALESVQREIDDQLLEDAENRRASKGVRLAGQWQTEDGRRVFKVDTAQFYGPGLEDANTPMRICMFLTDGKVGNDMAIVDAVKENAHTTRVFAFGIGNSVNRYLLANMAHAGRGEVEFVIQESDRDAAVERFANRIQSPVLTDIELEFSDGIEVTDVVPRTPGGLIPDVYDERPIVLHGRYAKAGEGRLTIRGRTGAGAFERTIELDFANEAPGHDVVKTLWARGRIEELTNEDLTGVQLGTLTLEQKQPIVDLGVEFQLLSQFTSFVAVEKSRVVVDGESMLVRVPIELANDEQWSGFFGERGMLRDDVIKLAVDEVYLGTQVRRVDPREVYYTIANANAIAEAEAVYLEAARSYESDPADRDGRKQQQIHDNLLRIRELQMQRQYPEALELVSQILFLDEGNAVALTLRDALQTAALWESYLVNERERKLSLAVSFESNRSATLAPPSNFGPEPRSTSGLMTYPEVWSDLSVQRGGLALGEVQKNPFVMDFAEGSTRTGLPAVRGSVDDQRVLRTQLQLLFGETEEEVGRVAIRGNTLTQDGVVRGGEAERLSELATTTQAGQTLTEGIVTEAERLRRLIPVVGDASGAFQPVSITLRHADSAALAAEIADLEAKVEQLGRTAGGEQWLTEQRAAEIRQLSRNVLQDAGTRESLLQRGSVGRNDGEGFFLGNQDGRLDVSGQMQARYLFGVDHSDNENESRSGFENSRTKLTFDGNVVSPDWAYRIDESLEEYDLGGRWNDYGRAPLLGDIPLLGEMFEPKREAIYQRALEEVGGDFSQVDFSMAGSPFFDGQMLEFSGAAGGGIGRDGASQPVESFAGTIVLPNQREIYVIPETAHVLRVLDDITVPVEFSDSPLIGALQQIAETFALAVRVDWEGLEGIGITPDAPVSYQSESATIREVLEALLGQLGEDGKRPTYSIHDGVLGIATPEALREQVVALVYDVRDVVEGIEALRDRGIEGEEALIIRLMAEVDPDSWRDNGGSVGSVRHLTGRLIITQTDANHGKVQAMLADMRLREQLGAGYRAAELGVLSPLDQTALRIDQITEVIEFVESQPTVDAEASEAEALDGEVETETTEEAAPADDHAETGDEASTDPALPEDVTLGIDVEAAQPTEAIEAAPRVPPILFLLNPGDPANARFFGERTIMLIADLDRAEHHTQARRLTAWLLELDETYDPAKRMLDVLSDAGLAQLARDERVDDLADLASESIAASLRSAVLNRELVRRLGESLQTMIREDMLARAEGEDLGTQDVGLSVAKGPAGIRVTVLVDSLTDETVEGLRQAGLNVADTAEKASLVVGTAEIDRLTAIALAPGVRRVEAMD